MDIDRKIEDYYRNKPLNRFNRKDDFKIEHPINAKKEEEINPVDEEEDNNEER